MTLALSTATLDVIAQVTTQITARLDVLSAERARLEAILAIVQNGNDAAPAPAPAPIEVAPLVAVADAIRGALVAEVAKSAPTPAAKPSAKKPDTRAKNPRKLKDVLVDVMTGQPPRSAADLAEAVLATGYKTSSGSFRQVVFAMMSDHPELYRKVGDGTWKLAPGKKGASA